MEGATNRKSQFAVEFTADPACNIRVAGAVGQLRSDLAVSEWIEEIRKIWARGATSTLELARVVCQIRNLLSCAEWKEFWRPGRTPFRIRKAYALVAIGVGLGWADLQTFARLPRGWSILQHLAKLERRLLEHLIEEKFVHPELTLAQARELVAKYNGKRKAPRRPNVIERVQKFANFLDSTLDGWTARERAAARRILADGVQTIFSEAELTLITPNPSKS